MFTARSQPPDPITPEQELLIPSTTPPEQRQPGGCSRRPRERVELLGQGFATSNPPGIPAGVPLPSTKDPRVTPSFFKNFQTAASGRSMTLPELGLPTSPDPQLTIDHDPGPSQGHRHPPPALPPRGCPSQVPPPARPLTLSPVRRSLTGPFLRPPGLDMSPAAGRRGCGAAAAARGPGPAGGERGGGDGEARRSHHSGRGCGPSSRRRGRHGRRVPDVPSVVAMSRGGSGTPSSPLLPLLLPRPGPHNKAAAAAGRAASARAPAASTQPPPPFPPLSVARPGSRRGWSAEAGGVRLRRSRLGDRPLPPPPALLSKRTRSCGRRGHSSAAGGGEETEVGRTGGAGRGRGGAWAGARWVLQALGLEARLCPGASDPQRVTRRI